MRNKQLISRIEQLENNSRYVQNALEMALSLGDFQENINTCQDPSLILQEAEKRIKSLIPFEICAFYLVNDGDPDITLCFCNPKDDTSVIESEAEFMIKTGLFAWTLREKRGIIIRSKNRQREYLLHPIATYAQIKGLFVGLLPDKKIRIPDAGRSLLSLILLNAANAMESLNIYRTVQEKNEVLETEIKKRTKDLLEYEKRLQRIQKMEAIGTLAGGVAHDLNNILSGLVSYPELLLMELPEKSAFREPLQTIKKSGEKAAAIVQDLLTLARRGVNVLENVQLNDVIRDYLESPEFEKLLFYHPLIHIEKNLDGDLLQMAGSPVHLSKTIMNLVSNAAEAIPKKGKITITTTNQYLDSPFPGYGHIQKGDYIRLDISDTGTGISPEEKEKIFEPFYTKKIMGKSGTGLGMTVVWGTVNDHHGHIDIQTQKDKGTTFKIFFPAIRESALVQKEHHDQRTNYYGNGETILIIDDLEDQRIIASEMLSKLGYSVTAVAGGEKAIAYLEKHSVDLLLLDMIMSSEMDGLETYKRALQLNPKQKAVIVSGFSESQAVKTARHLGAGQFIKKPYSFEKIGLAVKKELEK